MIASVVVQSVWVCVYVHVPFDVHDLCYHSFFNTVPIANSKWLLFMQQCRAWLSSTKSASQLRCYEDLNELVKNSTSEHVCIQVRHRTTLQVHFPPTKLERAFSVLLYTPIWWLENGGSVTNLYADVLWLILFVSCWFIMYTRVKCTTRAYAPKISLPTEQVLDQLQIPPVLLNICVYM